MLARVCTFAIDGVDPRQVWVEVDIRSGLPAFAIVGLGDAAVRESRDRVRAAIQNSDFEFPQTRITANLAPAFLRKVGPGFDAALALGVLAATGQVPVEALASYVVFGELSLSGELRDSPGALAVAEGARRAGIERLIVPRERSREAALVEGVSIVAAASLRSAAEVVKGADPPPLPRGPGVEQRLVPEPDLSDIRGHAAPLLALQIAAAGSHNLLLEGAPGTEDDAGPTSALDSAGDDARRSDRGHQDPQCCRHPCRRAGLRASVSGTSSHDLTGGAGRRGIAAAAGRGDARKSWRAVPR